MAHTRYFNSDTFLFLEDLAVNNNREWFQENKQRYEEHIKDPAMCFIGDFGAVLKKISKHFSADPRPVGGSLFRIYRDVRFSKDKSPYKTNTGIQFRHVQGKDAHAPGYYLHLEPENVFAAVGIWHPDSETLAKIREAIAERPSDWKRAARGKLFRSRFELSGDSLRRAPKGFEPDHPMIEDLKRKDYIGKAPLSQEEVTGPKVVKTFEEICRAGSSLVRFLCAALGLPF